MSCSISADVRPGGQPNLTEVTGEAVLYYSYNNQDHDGAGINDNLGSFTIGTTYNMNIQFTNAHGSASIVIAQHLGINSRYVCFFRILAFHHELISKPKVEVTCNVSYAMEVAVIHRVRTSISSNLVLPRQP
jgi:hypothetical protein